MSSFLSATRRILSDKWLTLAILFFAIAGRIIQLIFFFNIRLDASHQVIATRNFLDGHGISMAKAYAIDLSTSVYEPLINWPPGYSILLAPFYALFGGNYIAAGLCLGIIAAVTLIFVCRCILKLLDLPLYLINLSTIIAGFYIYYFYFIASSDAITICLAAIAIYFALRLLKQPPQRWMTNTTGMTIPLFICGAIKYLFIPVALVIPVYIALRGFTSKEKNLKRAGILSTVILVLTLAGLLAWQKSISGSATYISEPGRGFFPQHLLAFFPFIPGAFIKPDTIAMVIPGSYAEFVYLVFKLLHVVLLLALTFVLLRIVIAKRFRNISLVPDFFILTLLISWAITLLLGLLSVQVEKEAWQGGHMWTYIEEQRYYGLPIVLIQLAAFVYYHHYRENRKIIIRYVLLLLFLLMMIEVMRGIFFDVKRIKHFQKEEYSWQSEYKVQQFADSIIKRSLAKSSASKVVVGGPFYYINHRVSLFSNVPLLGKPEWINDLSSLQTKEPVLLLVVLREENFKDYQAFLRSGIEVAGQFNGLYFYTVYVYPR
jgi:hypothetical protein